jgi:hypothetical protein
MAAAIAANRGRQLLVGGLRDELWVSSVAHRLGEGGCDVLELPEADHSMGTDDAVRTAELHVDVVRAIDAFLSHI